MSWGCVPILIFIFATIILVLVFWFLSAPKAPLTSLMFVAAVLIIAVEENGGRQERGGEVSTGVGS